MTSKKAEQKSHADYPIKNQRLNKVHRITQKARSWAIDNCQEASILGQNVSRADEKAQNMDRRAEKADNMPAETLSDTT